MKMSSSTAARSRKKRNAPQKISLYSQIKEGDTVSGTVRSLTDYGAFVDLGGVDALLHVGDICLGPRQQARGRALRGASRSK